MKKSEAVLAKKPEAINEEETRIFHVECSELKIIKFGPRPVLRIVLGLQIVLVAPYI